jgi:2-polyprenyl-3-methyl-5-hydroxy-6-metoxy-1,4-benzoquinol methylase
MNDDVDSAERAGDAGGPPSGERERQTVADFSRREFALREWMDGPATYAAWRAAALSLERVNRWTMGHVYAQEFLGQVLKRRKVTHEPLHVVDAGCGHGDGLRALGRWAAKRSVPLRLTGIDANPYAARLAKERDRREHVSAGTIAWVTGDLFAAQLARPADVVVSSLLAHHLSDEDVVRLLQWSAAQAQVAWMVCDLVRSERAAAWFARAAKWMRMDAMVQHDGAVSFRRAFTVAEWRGMVERAGVKADVRDVGWGRVCVVGWVS